MAHPRRPRGRRADRDGAGAAGRRPAVAWSRVELGTTIGMAVALVLLLAATASAFQTSARLQRTIYRSDIAAGNAGDVEPMAGRLAFALVRWADGDAVVDEVTITRGGLLRQLDTARVGGPTEEVRARYRELLGRARALDAAIVDQQQRSPDPSRGPAEADRTRELAAQADEILRAAQRNRQAGNRALVDLTRRSQAFDHRNRVLAIATGTIAVVLGVVIVTLLRRRLRTDHEQAVRELADRDRRRQAAVELVNDQAAILEQIAAGAPTAQVQTAILTLVDAHAGGRWALAPEPDPEDGGAHPPGVGLVRLDRLDREERARHLTGSDAAELQAEATSPLSAGARLLDTVRSRDQMLGALAHQATHDALTDVFNRAAIVAVLEEALTAPDTRGTSVAFLFCDLDRFKFVNDTFGHDVGDELLRHVARGLEAASDEVHGIVGRMGGDEFGLVLAGADEDGARNLAQVLTAAIGGVRLVAGHRVEVDLCVGLALAEVGTLRAEELLLQADLALYEAKGRGRSVVAVFDQGLAAAASRRSDIEQALQESLTDGGLEVHYQPIAPIDGEGVTEVEALVRWRRDGRLLEPAAFLSVAEDAGLIARVDAQVMAQACRDGAALAAAGHQVGIGVNVSAATLARPDFVDLVSRSVRAAGFRYDLLRLEVTEATLLQDTGDVSRKLETIRGRGASVAVDDFGTGYSSLQYLVELPLDALKIDRHFVDQLNTRTGDAIVEMIISLAGALGLTTIGEGVETPAQQARLAELGCDAVQGFLTGRPTALGELRARLDRTRLEPGVRTAGAPLRSTS